MNKSTIGPSNNKKKSRSKNKDKQFDCFGCFQAQNGRAIPVPRGLRVCYLIWNGCPLPWMFHSSFLCNACNHKLQYIHKEYGPLCQDYENLIVKFPDIIIVTNFIAPSNLDWNLLNVLKAYKTCHPNLKKGDMNRMLFNAPISQFKSNHECILLPYSIGTQIKITKQKGCPYYGDYELHGVVQDDSNINNMIIIKEILSNRKGEVSIRRIIMPDFDLKNQKSISQQASDCNKDRYIQIKDKELDNRKKKISRLSQENAVQASQIEELQDVAANNQGIRKKMATINKEETTNVRLFLEALPKDSRVRSHLLSSLCELENLDSSISQNEMNMVQPQQPPPSSEENLFLGTEPRGKVDTLALNIFTIIREKNGLIPTTLEEVKGNVIPGFAPPIRMKDLLEKEIVPKNWKIGDKDGFCTFTFRDNNNLSYILNILTNSDDQISLEFGPKNDKKNLKTMILDDIENSKNELNQNILDFYNSVVTPPPASSPTSFSSSSSSSSSSQSRQTNPLQPPLSSSSTSRPSTLMDPSYLGGGYNGIPLPSSNFGRGGMDGGMGDFSGDLMPGGGGGFSGGMPPSPGNLMGPGHPAFGGGFGGSGRRSDIPSHFPQPRYDPITPFPNQDIPPNHPYPSQRNQYEGEPNPDHLKPPVMNIDENDHGQLKMNNQSNNKNNKNNNNPTSHMYF